MSLVSENFCNVSEIKIQRNGNVFKHDFKERIRFYTLHNYRTKNKEGCMKFWLYLQEKIPFDLLIKSD